MKRALRSTTRQATVALALALGLCAPGRIASAAQQASAAVNGEETFLNRCSSCHGTDRALAAPRTKRGWEGVIEEMVNNGAQLEAAEREAILAFLTERHGLVNVNTASADEIGALGVSKKDAAAIVAYRTDHGPFADFAALRAVPGLDVDRLDAIRARVAFRD